MIKFVESELDDRHHQRRLRELAIAAQKSSFKSIERQKAISQLVREIYHSPKLGHPQKNSWSASFYTDVYREALQKTLLEVCQKIELYNPEHPVMAWVNFRLNKQLINAIDDFRKKGITNVPKSQQKDTVCLPNLANLEEQISVSNLDDDASLLKQFIEQDPEGLMAAEFLQNRPSVTFQVLALTKFLEDRSWSQIAAEIDVPSTTLCSFFYRCLKKLMPYFQKYLHE